MSNWKNPIDKVRSPKINLEPLEPANKEDIKKILNVCGDDSYGLRDRLILLVLMDIGVRASELINLNIKDINPVIGLMVRRNGKGERFRNAYLGRTSRQALRKYLKLKNAENSLYF
jgi:site-specific recombinase XerC